MYKTIQNIKGRIGNQLFEIANGYSYSKRHNRKLLLYLPQERDTYYKKYEWITSMFENTNNIDNCAVYHEAGNGSYNKIDNINSDIFLDGYFQDERYFKDYKNFKDTGQVLMQALENGTFTGANHTCIL